MKASLCLVTITIVLFLSCVEPNQKINNRKRVPKVQTPEANSGSYEELLQEIQKLKKTISSLSNQVMMQQFFVEERVRTEGNSGIKVVRGTNRGLKNYEYANHLAPAAFTIHDHSNYDRTLGLGEMHVVMNGVEFRTRHNDYKLVMPSTTSGDYHALQDIPFPPVPPEVLSQPNVSEQVREMRAFFKAFHTQSKKVRDYTKYFKPVLCYLEGAWTLDKNIEEPFPSDRHWVDASSWQDLHQKTRFTAYTGVKNRLENIAFLPTTISYINETTGEAQYAQWNYRILCSPIKNDLPLSMFIQEDDLTFRVDTGVTLAEAARGRAARFKLYDTSRKLNYQILDEIMATIPGKDNFGSNLTYTIFSEEMYDTAYVEQNVLLNTAYYHRAYKSYKSGAGGITYASLGFSDENLWVAQTSQPRVAPFEYADCRVITNKNGKPATRCSPSTMRVSYALPLEIVYMTPLGSWNPYNITFHNDLTTAIKDGRNGNKDWQALNGIDRAHFYMTPTEFFSGPMDKSYSADTVRSFMHVLAPDGEVKKVSASGTRIIMPEIDGVGKPRLRYIIGPVHGEGSSVWKELNALKDRDPDEAVPSTIMFEMSLSVIDPPGEHTHVLTLTYEEFVLLTSGDRVDVRTQMSQEHTHDLTIAYVPKTKTFKYVYCDNDVYCLDGHPPAITLETKNEFTAILP